MEKEEGARLAEAARSYHAEGRLPADFARLRTELAVQGIALPRALAEAFDQPEEAAPAVGFVYAALLSLAAALRRRVTPERPPPPGAAL